MTTGAKFLKKILRNRIEQQQKRIVFHGQVQFITDM